MSIKSTDLHQGNQPLPSPQQDKNAYKQALFMGAVIVTAGAVCAIARRNASPSICRALFQQFKRPHCLTNKVAHIKNQQQRTLAQFERNVKRNEWQAIRNSDRDSGCDRWMLPITRSEFGDRYSLTREEITNLRQDPTFVANHGQAAQRIAETWGWDLSTGAPVKVQRFTQTWNGLSGDATKAEQLARYHRMETSLEEMGQTQLLKNLRTFGDIWFVKGQGK